MGLLDGKVAVVTGGGTGIGRAVSIGLAAAGAKVVVNDYGVSVDGMDPSSEPANQVVADIRKAGGQAVAARGQRGHHGGRPRGGGSRAEGVRRPARAGVLRGHPARAHDLQHERGGLGRGHRGAPEGALHGDAAGHPSHARAPGGQHHHLHLHRRPRGQPGAAELLGGQGRHRGPHALHRAGHGEVRGALQRDLAHRGHPHDPAAARRAPRRRHRHAARGHRAGRHVPGQRPRRPHHRSGRRRARQRGHGVLAPGAAADGRARPAAGRPSSSPISGIARSARIGCGGSTR